jgi:PIN domain nuclease of toxin-antitoxin system
MQALLDTQAFLWAIADEEKLSRRAQQVYTGPNHLWLSVVSIWEILIKVRTRKLPMPQPTGSYLVSELAKNKIEILPLKLGHVLRLESLPAHHRDPFDRILIAQSLEEEIPLVTADPVFEKYPVRVIW